MPNLITQMSPETWQELEEIVRDILSECGMVANRNVHIALPRGAVDVDVLAEEEVDGVITRTICECKNWSSNIPKEVIHSFRTVMQETGAHRGYVISKVGFQTGAVEAATATNIELLTFDDFQTIYFDKWIHAQCWELENNIGSVNTYYEPFGIPGIKLLNDDKEIENYIETWRSYAFLGHILPLFAPYLRQFKKIPFPDLPLDVANVETQGMVIPDEIKTADSYRTLLKLLADHGEAGLRELRSLNPITRDIPFDEVETDD